MSSAFKPFPIPVTVMGGPGSQPEDEAMDFLPMPRDMATFNPPPLPEPEALAAHGGALGALQAALAALRRHLAGEEVAPIDLAGLAAADRALVNQVLGEGEVAAQVAAAPAGGPTVQAQESVFAGLWRVLQLEDGVVVRDTLEIGAIPQAVREGAACELAPAEPAATAPLLADLMNAPAVLEELRDKRERWQPGAPAHVVNLSLMPLTGGDSQLLESTLGQGRVMILSRGYGNCRIVNTRKARTWRVTYFNSQDMIILDTLEVAAVPEVACAAREDLEDSAERLGEVLQWVQAA